MDAKCCCGAHKINEQSSGANIMKWVSFYGRKVNEFGVIESSSSRKRHANQTMLANKLRETAVHGQTDKNMLNKYDMESFQISNAAGEPWKAHP